MVIAATAAIAVLRMVVIDPVPLLSSCLSACRVDHVDVNEDDRIVIKRMCTPSHDGFR